MARHENQIIGPSLFGQSSSSLHLLAAETEHEMFTHGNRAVIYKQKIDLMTGHFLVWDNILLANESHIFYAILMDFLYAFMLPIWFIHSMVSQYSKNTYLSVLFISIVTFYECKSAKICLN